MALTLGTPDVVNVTIESYKINSFMVDLERSEITVSYDKLDGAGVRKGEDIMVIDGPDFPAAIIEASSIAGSDVYVALKNALYNQMVSKTGKTGVVG